MKKKSKVKTIRSWSGLIKFLVNKKLREDLLRAFNAHEHNPHPSFNVFWNKKKKINDQWFIFNVKKGIYEPLKKKVKL